MVDLSIDDTLASLVPQAIPALLRGRGRGHPYSAPRKGGWPQWHWHEA